MSTPSRLSNIRLTGHYRLEMNELFVEVTDYFGNTYWQYIGSENYPNFQAIAGLKETWPGKEIEAPTFPMSDKLAEIDLFTETVSTNGDDSNGNVVTANEVRSVDLPNSKPLCYPGTTVPVTAIIVNHGEGRWDYGRVVGGLFASSKWLETGSHEGITGRSFGWFDLFDSKREYTTDKSRVRPMKQEEWNFLTSDQQQLFTLFTHELEKKNDVPAPERKDADRPSTTGVIEV